MVNTGSGSPAAGRHHRYGESIPKEYRTSIAQLRQRRGPVRRSAARGATVGNHGVKFFRVDNAPNHPTSGLADRAGEAVDPDVLFLSEAFTRQYGRQATTSLIPTAISPGARQVGAHGIRQQIAESAQPVRQHGHPARGAATFNNPGMFAITRCWPPQAPAWGCTAVMSFLCVRCARGTEYLDVGEVPSASPRLCQRAGPGY